MSSRFRKSGMVRYGQQNTDGKGQLTCLVAGDRFSVGMVTELDCRRWSRTSPAQSCALIGEDIELASLAANPSYVECPSR
ncbi:MAG: hypothetical protein AAFR31_21170 [Cyanobacteria bacterium J06627_8]